jgi:hypothetical protein
MKSYFNMFCCHCVASSAERWCLDASALCRRPSDGVEIRAHAAAAYQCSAASWADKLMAVDVRGCGSYHARCYTLCNRACKLWRPCAWSWRELSSGINGEACARVLSTILHTVCELNSPHLCVN